MRLCYTTPMGDIKLLTPTEALLPPAKENNWCFVSICLKLPKICYAPSLSLNVVRARGWGVGVGRMALKQYHTWWWWCISPKKFGSNGTMQLSIRCLDCNCQVVGAILFFSKGLHVVILSFRHIKLHWYLTLVPNRSKRKPALSWQQCLMLSGRISFLAPTYSTLIYILHWYIYIYIYINMDYY